jgi:hypothetical protein
VPEVGVLALDSGDLVVSQKLALAGYPTKWLSAVALNIQNCWSNHGRNVCEARIVLSIQVWQRLGGAFWLMTVVI